MPVDLLTISNYYGHSQPIASRVVDINRLQMIIRLIKKGERAVLPAPKAGWSMQTAECNMLVLNLEPAERNAGGAVLSLDALKMILRSRDD
jgi:hypothetical protein